MTIEKPKDLAYQFTHLRAILNEMLKPSRELSLAFTKIDEAAMWTREAIEAHGFAGDKNEAQR